MSDTVIRLKPFEYCHVLDNNENVTRVEIGPQTITRKDHERLLFNPTPMVTVPPRHYVIIRNPVIRKADGSIDFDDHGQAKVNHGDEEIRFEQLDPFPLYPGETLFGKVSPLQVVSAMQALRLRAIRDFEADGVARVAGDEWLFEGPATYKPRVEVQVVEIVRAVIVQPSQALQLRARKETVDAAGIKRKAGEEYTYQKPGAYMPGVDEEVVQTLNAFVLTAVKALHLLATRSFRDVYGVKRKAGEEWLVTVDMAPQHIPDVYEKVKGEVHVTTLTNMQYCVVLDPFDKETKKVRLGQKELRKGEACFFLHPGEHLQSGIQDVYVLGEEEALLLRANEACKDLDSKGAVVVHEPGDRWMVYGPRDYVPPVEVSVVEKRRAIPLDTNEGVYVRDIKDGKVSMKTGQSYMLKPNEELWEKDLPATVETLLRGYQVDANGERDKTRVVTYRAPHNTAVQIYDYKAKKSRVALGPELVMLGPEEQFTLLSLSGDKPKRPHVIKALALFLGPDFMTDVVIVETSDHARLSLKLSYNWHFEVDPNDPAKIFQVPDFVGDSCKAIASRVRGAVAQSTFDQFHKMSATIIREAVFGVSDGTVGNQFVFSANNVVISNIDIQSVEPVDQRTRDSLQKSVQLAIEITTKSQEAAARHEAQRLEQEAKGRLERQRISDEAEAEKARRELLQLRAKTSEVESTGEATAEAKARAEANAIESAAKVAQAKLMAEALSIEAQADLALLSQRNELEIEHQKQLDELEISKLTALQQIESEKNKKVIQAIGPKTIAAIARGGAEAQAKLLGGLNLQSMLITDSNSPVNLLDFGKNLIKKN